MIIAKNQCDADGWPLDWKVCRTCAGLGEVATKEHTTVTGPKMCLSCGGLGSLEKWALYNLAISTIGLIDWYSNVPLRCENCGHPMSEGTWEGDGAVGDVELRFKCAVWDLQHGREPCLPVVHYSPCDTECKHGGPGRYQEPRRSGEARIWKNWQINDVAGPGRITDPALGNTVEASWRQVRIFFKNGWPHDLRPENLQLLCLRCEAEHGD